MEMKVVSSGGCRMDSGVERLREAVREFDPERAFESIHVTLPFRKEGRGAFCRFLAGKGTMTYPVAGIDIHKKY